MRKFLKSLDTLFWFRFAAVGIALLILHADLFGLFIYAMLYIGLAGN